MKQCKYNDIKSKEYFYFGRIREYTLERRKEIERLIPTTNLIHEEKG